MDLAERGEVLVLQHVGGGRGDLELLGQAIGAQPVGQAVAHRLDVTALVRGDLVDRNPVDQAGHVLVEVGAGPERLDQGLVAGQVRHDAQLDLGIVGAEQRLIPLAGNEGGTNLTSGGVPVGDVLQIGVHGTQPPRGGHRLLVGRVDAAVLLVGGLDQGLDDLLELVRLPVT